MTEEERSFIGTVTNKLFQTVLNCKLSRSNCTWKIPEDEGCCVCIMSIPACYISSSSSVMGDLWVAVLLDSFQFILCSKIQDFMNPTANII